MNSSLRLSHIINREYEGMQPGTGQRERERERTRHGTSGTQQHTRQAGLRPGLAAAKLSSCDCDPVPPQPEMTRTTDSWPLSAVRPLASLAVFPRPALAA